MPPLADFLQDRSLKKELGMATIKRERVWCIRRGSRSVESRERHIYRRAITPIDRPRRRVFVGCQIQCVNVPGGDGRIS